MTLALIIAAALAVDIIAGRAFVIAIVRRWCIRGNTSW